MARQQMKGMGTLDPASTFINQYNPVAMLAQATQNVRLATISGKNEGYMWEAQALNMAKAPIVASGSALVMYAAGPALGDPVTKGLAMLAGGALSFIGNSIQVNPTTGERALKATDQSVIATSAAFVGSLFGGAQLFNTAGSVLFAGGSSLAQSSVRYDGEGRAQGMSLTSRHGDGHGERAVLNATTAMITSAAGAYAGRNGGFGTESNLSGAVFGDIVATGTNVLTEYGAQQTWGKDKSGYDALTRPDAGRLGGFAGSMLLAANKDRYENAAIEAAERAAKEGRTQEALNILKGGGFAEDRRRQLVGRMAAKALLDRPVEGGADNFAKLLRTAAAADGRLGPRSAASMAAGEQLNTQIANDVSELSRDGELSLADGLKLAEKYKVDPALLFSAANAEKAGALFSQNWNGAYRAQVGKEAAAQNDYGPQMIDSRKVSYSTDDPRGPGYSLTVDEIVNDLKSKHRRVTWGDVEREISNRKGAGFLEEYKQAQKSGSAMSEVGFKQAWLDALGTAHDGMVLLNKLGPNALGAAIYEQSGLSGAIHKFLDDVSGAKDLRQRAEGDFLDGVAAYGDDPELMKAFEFGYRSNYRVNYAQGAITQMAAETVVMGGLGRAASYLGRIGEFIAPLARAERTFEGIMDMSHLSSVDELTRGANYLDDVAARLHANYRNALPQTGEIPTFASGKFDPWFERLTPAEIELLYSDKVLRSRIEDALRGGKGAGVHEYLTVGTAPHWKGWADLTMREFRQMTEVIETLNSTKAKDWQHVRGLEGTARNSSRVHLELRDIINASDSLHEFKVKIRSWADKWLIRGFDDLPPGFHS